MRPIHHLVIAGLAPLLVNCSTHPLVDDVTRATTSDVVKHIRCEAKRAVIDDDVRSKKASANTIAAVAYEFTFTITENNNAKGDISWDIPFLNGSDFSLVANADSERQRFSRRNFRIVETFDDLRKADCSRETLEKNLIYPIAGEIGIYEVVTTFAKLQRLAKLAPLPASPDNPAPPGFDPTIEPQGTFRFADTLTFTTTFSGGVNPSLALKPVTNSFRVVGVNTPGAETSPLAPPSTAVTVPGLSPLEPLATGLTALRQDTHKVVISMASLPKTTDSARRNAGVRAPLSSHAITSTTSFQLEATAKERALFELDRQRMLALQQQSPNLLVGP
jgi:hypothetical protein